ncbi:unnamed protein product [Adineta ricciae]|uniref:Uncharacterized protein n=1 Tax=Adineta ricciae TaxID=249248 RepID=A0A816A7S1_ADIRI|nr:unnamed protein product [Adineta ricciae]
MSRTLRSTVSVARITSLDDYHRLPSSNSSNMNSIPSIKQSQNRSKSFRLSFGTVEDLYTVGKKDMNKKRHCKLCASCSALVFVTLALLISLLVAAIVTIPTTIIMLQKQGVTITTTTILTTSVTTTIFSTTTSPLTTVSTTTIPLVTTTATTSTVTGTSTTASSTSAASTVTITSNICTSMLTGIEIVASCAPCSTFNTYLPFAYNYTAIANVTRMAFAFRRQTQYFALDEVSIQDFAALGTELLVNGGFETGSLAPWIYCDQNNANSTGGVQSTFSYNSFNYSPKSGTYYYVGGSTVAADYIMQAFPTIIGHEYQVHMWAMHPGSGSLTSADFFLGV